MKIKKQLKISAIIVLVSGVNILSPVSATPSSYVAVNKETCSRLLSTKQAFILVLNKGDDLVKSINQCASDAKLHSASVSGLGQIYKPTLAYFTNNPNDKPTLTSFPGYYELAALHGNITNNANQYYTHLHAVLADKEFKGIAGHIDKAKVGLTVEVTIVPLSGGVERMVDHETGFGLIATK